MFFNIFTISYVLLSHTPSFLSPFSLLSRIFNTTLFFIFISDIPPYPLLSSSSYLFSSSSHITSIFLILLSLSPFILHPSPFSRSHLYLFLHIPLYADECLFPLSPFISFSFFFSFFSFQSSSPPLGAPREVPFAFFRLCFFRFISREPSPFRPPFPVLPLTILFTSFFRPHPSLPELTLHCLYFPSFYPFQTLSFSLSLAQSPVVTTGLSLIIFWLTLKLLPSPSLFFHPASLSLPVTFLLLSNLSFLLLWVLHFIFSSLHLSVPFVPRLFFCTFRYFWCPHV